MATESVILTALPNGVARDGRLRVTAFTSPRLSTDGAASVLLREFPAFRDWPAALQTVRFAVEFQGHGTADAEFDANSPSPSSDVWAQLFDPNTVQVRDGKAQFPDLSDRKVHSFPAATVMSYVLNLYRQVASTNGVNFPALTSGPLVQLVRDIGQLNAKDHFGYRDLEEKMREEVGPNGKAGRYLAQSSVPAGQQAQYAFLQAARYYDRGSADPLGPGVVPPRPEVPTMDFHNYVASLGDYRELLRLTGLAIDFLVDAPNASPTGLIRMRARTDAASEPSMEFLARPEARPWTNYELRDNRFVARPFDGDQDFESGMLRLDDNKVFDVHQVDVDGSALKTVDFAANAARMRDHLIGQGDDTMRPDAASLPALRTGGFVVTRRERDARVVQQFDKAAKHEADHRNGDAPELWAQDVIRGYRVDVEDLTAGGWLPLYERVGSYVTVRGGVAENVQGITPEDEGFAKGSSTTSTKTGKPDDDDLYLHEALFGWDGWSMVVKRPGQPIAKESNEIPDNRPEDDFPLVTSFEVTDGSLPRLRFGRQYRFRARAVDMAANSVEKRRIDKDRVTDAHKFTRFDPVPSPAVVPRRQFSEGESLLRMVIRSTKDVLPKDYVALARIVGLAGHSAGDGTEYRDVNDRHLAPPKTAVQLAEWHGMFDAALALTAQQSDIDAQFDIAVSEDGSYVDAVPGAFVVNPVPGQTATNLSSHTKGDALKNGEYVCHDVAKLHLPYLPDVLSAGAALTSLPGDPNGAMATRFQPWDGGQWPDRKPFLLRIADGGKTDDPQKDLDWNATGRVLTVFLRQAELVTVRLSSAPIPGALDLLGVWGLIPSPTQQQKANALAGWHWMLTPYQDLTLVHAVEKPLRQPVINVTDAGVRRRLGETFAWMEGTIENHAKSTGRLDVDAEWTEPIDDLKQSKPGVLEGRAHVGDFGLTATEEHCVVGRDDAPLVHKLRHEFHDTKHRLVTYRATATTRFREYFPTQITNDPKLITDAGPDRELRVRSSRRPEPPDILYAVPTFSWHDEPLRRPRHLGDKRQQWRRTRRAGVRVYLRRPWFSSGANELLGVVVPDQPYLWWHIDERAGLRVDRDARVLAEAVATRILADDADLGVKMTRTRGAASQSARLLGAIKPEQLAEKLVADRSIFRVPLGDVSNYVTRWGADPIWGSDHPASGPWIRQFPLRADVGTGLSIAEVSGQSVAVVGHEVEFDETRQLWFCDIDIDAGASYFPFVRLALARYQPYSIEDAHLSRIVTPEWAQLPAERSASVTEVEPQLFNVSLRGPAGYTQAAVDLVGIESDAETHRMKLSRFAVVQAERLPHGARSDLDWVPFGDEVELDLRIASAYDDIRYSGRLMVPKTRRGDRVRLSVREYELLLTDKSEAQGTLVNDKITDISVNRVGMVTVDGEHVERPVRHRLVYADHFDV